MAPILERALARPAVAPNSRTEVDASSATFADEVFGVVAGVKSAPNSPPRDTPSKTDRPPGARARLENFHLRSRALQKKLLRMIPEAGDSTVRAAREEMLPSLRAGMKPAELISDILKTNPGVFVGDWHGSFAIPEFLSDSMQSFRKDGVKRLYIEMFKSEDQPILDRFWAQGDNRQELVDHLKKNGWNQAKGWPERIVSMLESAKKSDIRPYGIDTQHTEDSRLETSNPHWVSVIQSQEAKASTPGRYIVWGGAGHSANYPANKGVDWRLGIPSVDLKDSADVSAPEIQKGDGRGNDFEVTLPRHPDQPRSLF